MSGSYKAEVTMLKSESRRVPIVSARERGALMKKSGHEKEVVRVLMETARSLKQQAEILRKQSRDLMMEAERIWLASKRARAGSSRRRQRKR